MIELAREQAEQGGLRNLAFTTGDITDLSFADGVFDGVVTRFSLHHIPLPRRALQELTRVVKAGGWVVVADHLTAEEMQSAAWHQEIERLRDPTHWACLSAAQLRHLGAQAGLELVREEQWPFALDYEEWLTRGSTGRVNRALIDRTLAEHPNSPPIFRFREPGKRETVRLTYGAFIWKRPASLA